MKINLHLVFSSMLATVWLCFFLPLVSTISIDYFDAYHYLINARAWQMVDEPLALAWRAPTLSAIYGGLSSVFGLSPSLPSAHWLSFALSILAILSAGIFFLPCFSPAWALCALFLFAFHPVFFHYTPFFLSDIPALALLCVGLRFYWQDYEKPNRVRLTLTCLFLGLAALTKYSLLALPAVFFLFVCLQGSFSFWKQKLFRHFLLPTLGLVLVWFGIQCFALIFVYPAPGNVFVRLVGIIEHYLSITGHFKQFPDPWYEYFLAIAKTFGAALCLITGFGLWRALKDRRFPDLFCLSWLLGLFLPLWLLIAHKETRYLFPVLVPLIYLAVRGLEEIFQILTRLPLANSLKTAIHWTVILICFVPFLSQTLSVANKLQSPFFRTPWITTLTSTVQAHLGEQENTAIYWSASPYSLYPQKPLFLFNDSFFYFFHFGPEALAYHTQREVIQVPRTQIGVNPRNFFLEQEVTKAVWVQSHPELITTANYHLHKSPPPLRLHFFKRELDSTTGKAQAQYWYKDLHFRKPKPLPNPFEKGLAFRVSP